MLFSWEYNENSSMFPGKRVFLITRQAKPELA
jgi:hypothetical protein